ncbi:MAG: hypothetical protein HUJ75_04495 [Parasporobacterium sp.]|nr:hypothetical protein [Parasporobacterium sp.]
MDKKTKNTLLDIAAEILVAPITLYVAGSNAAKSFCESEFGKKAVDTVKTAGDDIKEAAKKASEHENVVKAKEAVKNFTESEDVQKAVDSIRKAWDQAGETANDVKGVIVETAANVRDTYKDAAQSIREAKAEAKAEAEAAEAEAEVEEAVDSVDLSEVLGGEADAEETPAPEAEENADIDEELDRVLDEIAE